MENFKKSLLSAFLIIFPILSHAEQIVVGGPWGGIHNTDSASDSVLIDDNEAADMLNIDIDDDGRSIRKRNGYNLITQIGTSSHSVKGGYVFYDATATQTLIFSNDKSLYKQTDFGGSSFSAFVTTDTAGSYYDFVDFNGSLWRANSSRDEILSYDGTNVTYYPSLPKGNQIELLPDRLVIANTAANKSRINFSAAGDFTNFTVGNEEEDPFNENIGTAGNEVTAIKSYCGGLLIWTPSSFSIWTGDSQHNSRIDKISEALGTTQPYTVVEANGAVYWQAADWAVYSYDCNTVRKVSRKIDQNTYLDIPESPLQNTASTDWLGRIWFSTPLLGRTMIYDERYDAWLRYSFSLGQNIAKVNRTNDPYEYFGGYSTYTVNRIRTIVSDNGEIEDGGTTSEDPNAVAVSAQWISKSFAGNPFIEKNYLTYSTFTKSIAEGTIGLGYFLDGVFVSSSSFSTATSNTYQTINARFPSGKTGKNLNFYILDGTDNMFRVYSFGIEYINKPWRVSP